VAELTFKPLTLATPLSATRPGVGWRPASGCLRWKLQRSLAWLPANWRLTGRYERCSVILQPDVGQGTSRRVRTVTRAHLPGMARLTPTRERIAHCQVCNHAEPVPGAKPPNLQLEHGYDRGERRCSPATALPPAIIVRQLRDHYCMRVSCACRAPRGESAAVAKGGLRWHAKPSRRVGTCLH
jgi:hypothetical protein